MTGESDPPSSSRLAEEISAILAPGMELPESLRLLFAWIESKGLFNDSEEARTGFLHPPDDLVWTHSEDWGRDVNTGRRGGTFITFSVEGNEDLESWFPPETIETRLPEIRSRLSPFCRTGTDGSMGAFWLDADGHQRIVHAGSGSGSTLQCVLADNAIDFLRLVAIGYDEICSADFSQPPNSYEDDEEDKFVIYPNVDFRDWVADTFKVTIPLTGSEIVRHPSHMGDKGSPDPFWNWIEKLSS